MAKARDDRFAEFVEHIQSILHYLQHKKHKPGITTNKKKAVRKATMKQQYVCEGN